jgi:hypothetical protein
MAPRGPSVPRSTTRVRALAALGRPDDAIRFAEASRGVNDSPVAIAAACEEVLLASGRAEEAYRRYALEATRGTSYLAARDFADVRPEFAIEAGLAALHWLVEGYGYEITSADVWPAYTETVKAAERAGRAGEARDRIRSLVTARRTASASSPGHSVGCWVSERTPSRQDRVRQRPLRPRLRKALHRAPRRVERVRPDSAPDARDPGKRATPEPDHGSPAPPAARSDASPSRHHWLSL